MKNKNSVLEKSSLEKLIAEDEAKLKEASTKKTSDAQYSFGQSGGLKDDLDVDDNDVGMRFNP